MTDEQKYKGLATALYRGVDAVVKEYQLDGKEAHATFGKAFQKALGEVTFSDYMKN
jgi:hypothetical protein